VQPGDIEAQIELSIPQIFARSFGQLILTTGTPALRWQLS
jgi:hypothetical protein